LLGQGMMVLGIPVAVTTAFQAHRVATDRGFVYAAIVVLGLQLVGVAAALIVWPP